jgi:hypothetical protein
LCFADLDAKQATPHNEPSRRISLTEQRRYYGHQKAQKYRETEKGKDEEGSVRKKEKGRDGQRRG